MFNRRQPIRVFNRTQPIWRVHVSGQWLDIVAEHPVFVVGKGWVQAAELQPGDRVKTVDGAEARIDGVAKQDGEAIAVDNVLDMVAKSLPGMHAFTGDTQIMAADGPKRVDEIRVGDFILTDELPPPERN